MVHIILNKNNIMIINPPIHLLKCSYLKINLIQIKTSILLLLIKEYIWSKYSLYFKVLVIKELFDKSLKRTKTNRFHFL